MPRASRLLLWLVLAAWLAAPTAAAATGIEPAGKPAPTAALSQIDGAPFDAPSSRLEEQLFADAADGRLEEFSPLEAALVAGGVQDVDTLHRYGRKATALVEQMRCSGGLGGSLRQQAKTIHWLLHRWVFRGGYDLACTDLRCVFDEGRFNCVSATVLFNHAASNLGLDCRGLEMPGHAMSRVVLPDGTLDVETTSPRWLELENDARGRPVAHAEHADRSKAREVSPIQLAAMVYYNRGVDLLGEKRFAEAARANAKAVRLDPTNAAARGNLLATINNWSIELGNAQRFSQAVDLLRRGLAIDAEFEAFARNYVHVHRQWADHLCREHHFEMAIEILSRAAAEMPDRDCLRKVQSEVRRHWAKAVAAE